MAPDDSTAASACRRFVDALLTRKHPRKVVQSALARAGKPKREAREDAFAALAVIAVGLGVPTPFMDDETHARTPRLAKLEALESDVMRALGPLLAEEDELASHATKLRQHFMERFSESEPSDDALPLFTQRARESSAPLFVSAPIPVPEHATRTGDLRASLDFTGPLDDVDAVQNLLARLAVRSLEEVVDETFAPVFDAGALTPERAREAYALCAVLAIGAARLPKKMLPRELTPLATVLPTDVTRGALTFAKSVLERLELPDSALRLAAPDADLRGRVRLRVRALARVLVTERRAVGA